MNGLGVARIHGAGEAVFGVVRQFQRMAKITRAGNRQHRSENLFLKNARLGFYAREYGRLHEIALSRQDAAARDQPSLSAADFDVIENGPARARADYRTHEI